MGEMENQAEFYYEKLRNSSNSGLVLCEFFSEITGKEVGRSEIIMINKLVRLFGRFTVYFSIMELSKFSNLDDNLYPLLYTICRSRFERMHEDSSVNAHVSLDRQITYIQKEADKLKGKKVKIPDSKGLENEQ